MATWHLERTPILLNRRAMLGQSLTGAMLAALAGNFAPLLAAPGSRWFKIGACDWSLGKRCDPAALDLAKQIGLDGVQVAMGDPGNDMQFRLPEVQKKYQEATQRTGLEIASIAIDAMWGGPLKSDPRAAEWLRQGIDAATAMGIPNVMIVCFDVEMDKTAEVDQFVKVLQGIMPKAEKQNVLVSLENWLSAEDNMRIIERVGSPALKVYYDVGNSTDKGRDVCKEIRTLGSLICELHAKDGPHMLGQGRIDFREVRKTLDDINYSGWIHLEAAAPHDLIADYTAHKAYLKNIFPEKNMM